MIQEEWRYWASTGSITPGGPSKWHVVDWDQRRIITVTMDEEQDSADLAIEHLKKHIDTLGPDVYDIHLSPDGTLISTSTDPRDDHTMCVYYPPLQHTPRPDRVNTVLRSELRELDRIGQNVDLVSYTPPSEATKQVNKVVFKYYFIWQFMKTRWSEMNLWMWLPPHPNIVPFDRIVLDEMNGHIVGFTSVYIPGGTIDENGSRVFKLKWLKQLMHVVDDLNLRYGVMHQDIAARNLVVDSNTDSVMLFDFNFSARIGVSGGPCDSGYSQDRNDVKGVIFTAYEIITRDQHFRDVPPDQQDTADLDRLEEWVQHPDVKLDHHVSEYRSVLNEWAERRREGKQIAIYTEAPEYIDWPTLPSPPKKRVRHTDGTSTVWEIWMENRRDKGKGNALNWERPPQNRLGSVQT
ncbi:hypothetical protein F5X98DRAFT_381056 [Xylaria grammica]|nr:hypothetical protein F5X98DRAFT_381056 [Xylaria grammica]